MQRARKSVQVIIPKYLLLVEVKCESEVFERLDEKVCFNRTGIILKIYTPELLIRVFQMTLEA